MSLRFIFALSDFQFTFYVSHSASLFIVVDAL